MMLASEGLVSGHATLADWLFLIAAVGFLVAAVLIWVDAQPAKLARAVVAVGLCLGFVGWFVL